MNLNHESRDMFMFSLLFFFVTVIKKFFLMLSIITTS